MASAAQSKEERNISTRSNFLPPDLVESILAWLPPESLVRFKCVCKSWQALFHHPNFVFHHLSNSTQRQKNLILNHAFYNPETQRFHRKLFCISSKDAGFSPLNINGCKYPSNLKISGHCNGIICLYCHRCNCWDGGFDGKDVALYNPATKALRLLPLSPTPPFANFIVVMGCDPETNDYNVVKIAKAIYEPGSIVRVDEYALSTDSWTRREVTYAGDFMLTLYYGSAIHQKGIFYLRAHELTGDGMRPTILALKVEHGVLHRLPMPAGFGRNDGYLDVFNESMIALVEKLSSGCHEIWVMDTESAGFGGPEGCSSWRKLPSINPAASCAAPLVFWNGNGLLMQTKSGELQSYNIGTQESENVGIKLQGDTKFRVEATQVVSYVKSIVSLN